MAIGLNFRPEIGQNCGCYIGLNLEINVLTTGLQVRKNIGPKIPSRGLKICLVYFLSYTIL